MRFVQSLSCKQAASLAVSAIVVAAAVLTGVEASLNMVGLFEQDDPTVGINDGDLIRNASHANVYLVKRVDDKRFVRLILNEDVMKTNGWAFDRVNNNVTGSQLRAFELSSLIRLQGSQEVYEVEVPTGGDVATKRLLDVRYDFLESVGIDPDSVFEVNERELALYEDLR